MHIFNWAQAFKQQRTFEDIPSNVQKTEIGYWIWLMICILWGFLGMLIILIAPQNSLKAHFWGLLLILEGSFLWAVIKIVAHIRLAMYWILWDSQNRIAAELRQSQAADL